MSVITWPDTLYASRMRMELRQNGAINEGPFGMQFVKTGSPRWAATVESTTENESNSGAWKALLLQLRGPTNQIALHDLGRPVPLGSLRGTLTFAANADSGATSAQIASSTTNLLTNSEQFDNATWSKVEATVSVNAINGPDGTLTADKLIESASTAQHYTLQSNSTAGNAIYTFSVFVQEGGRSTLHIDFGGTGSYRASFDLVALTTANFGGVVSSITDALNGWRRCVVTLTTPLDLSSGYVPIIFINQYGSYSGDGVSGIYLWGAKLETGSSATDYGHGKTLLQGDLLGFGTGLTQQVVMLTESVTSTGQGNIAVTFEPPLRNAFSAGASITWDKPKVLYRNQAVATGWDYESVFASGFRLSLIEDCRP